MSTLPVAANRWAVSITCSSVSALHGPEIMSGRFCHACCAAFFTVSVACIIFVLSGCYDFIACYLSETKFNY
jgi:hypothetical protein